MQVAAGAGQDRYRSSGALSFAVTDAAGARPRASLAFGQAVTRTNLFADVSVRLGAHKLEGEVGQVSDGRVATYDRLATLADALRRYGELGFVLSRD